MSVDRVTDNMNQAFKGNWSSKIINIAGVDVEQGKNRKDGGNLFTAVSQCTVEVKAFNEGMAIVHQGFGIGVGRSRNKGDAMGNSKKSAASDALKRACKQFGKYFGCLLGEQEE
jgi:recombination DNA repair RAD52 pathway protein